MWKKVKERRLFLKRKEDILGINVLKIFPASLNRSVYFIQFVIKTWNSHVMPTLCWHPTFWWFCLWKRKQDDLHLAQTKYWIHCDHDLQHICTCLNVTDVLILFTAMLLQCINWSTIYLPYRVLTHSYDVKSQSLIFISAEQDAENENKQEKFISRGIVTTEIPFFQKLFFLEFSFLYNYNIKLMSDFRQNGFQFT